MEVLRFALSCVESKREGLPLLLHKTKRKRKTGAGI